MKHVQNLPGMATILPMRDRDTVWSPSLLKTIEHLPTRSETGDFGSKIMVPSKEVKSILFNPKGYHEEMSQRVVELIKKMNQLDDTHSEVFTTNYMNLLGVFRQTLFRLIIAAFTMRGLKKKLHFQRCE